MQRYGYEIVNALVTDLQVSFGHFSDLMAILYALGSTSCRSLADLY